MTSPVDTTDHGRPRPPAGSDREPGQSRALSAPATKPVGSISAFLPYLREHRATLIVIALISIVGAGLILVQPLLVQALIDRVSTGGPLTGLVVLLVVAALGDSVFGAVQSFLLQRTAEGVVLRARRTLIGHLLRLPIVEYDRRRIGDLISRVGADTTLLRSVVTSGLFDIVSSVLVCLGAIVLMAIVDVVLLLITLAAVAVGGAAIALVGRAMRGASLRAQESVGDMTAATERALSSIRTLRASSATERESRRVGEAAHRAYVAGVRMATLQSFVSPILNLAMQGSFIAVLAVGGYRVASQAMHSRPVRRLPAVPVRAGPPACAGLPSLHRHSDRDGCLRPDDRGPRSSFRGCRRAVTRPYGPRRDAAVDADTGHRVRRGPLRLRDRAAGP